MSRKSLRDILYYYILAKSIVSRYKLVLVYIVPVLRDPRPASASVMYVRVVDGIESGVRVRGTYESIRYRVHGNIVKIV